MERSGRGPAPPAACGDREAGRGGSAAGGWLPFTTALLEAVAVAVHLQDVDMMGEPVEQGSALIIPIANHSSGEAFQQ
jgi:hypothetical protein